MWYAFAFYWVVAGFAAHSILPDRDKWGNKRGLMDLVISLALGGVLVPARLLAKAIG